MMPWRAVALSITLSFAAPAAGEPELQLPVDCTLGDTCYIQQYLDHDPTDAFQDFQCNALSYNTHSGTDFALATVAQAKVGVSVLAAAAGTVLGTRDEMADVWSGQIDRTALQGRDCGNGVVLDHGDGWHTQYCHLKQGSVSVSNGQSVAAGTPLGEIGMTGRTQFPHLHLTVRQNGRNVDPFAPDGATCDAAPQRSLWADPIAYPGGGLLDIGFAVAVPDYENVKAGTADETIRRTSPAIVSFVYAFGGRTGDVLELTMTGPGDFRVQDRYDVPRNRALFFRAAGKKRRSAPWPGGTYTAQATLIRDGKAIDQSTEVITIPR